jgi:hypothetical protein
VPNYPTMWIARPYFLIDKYRPRSTLICLSESGQMEAELQEQFYFENSEII